MTRTFFLTAASAATLTFAGLTASATAAQAQNVLNVGGQLNVRDEVPGGGGDFLLIDFLTNGVAGFGTPGTVTAQPDTDLPGVLLGTVGLMNDLRADGTTFTGLPIAEFLSIGNPTPYVFTLDGSAGGNTFGPVSLLQVGNNTLAGFSAFGTVTGGAFGTSVRTFDLSVTSQFNNVTPAALFDIINSGGTRNSTFSATFTIAGPQQVIPEPSTYALLAAGLGALGLVARRRRTQA